MKMHAPTAVLVTFAAAVSLTGCGGSAQPRAVATSPSPSTSAAPTSSASTPLQVSTATTCRLLYEGVDRPLVKSVEQINAFLKDPTMKHNDVADLRSIADSLESIQARASDETAPYIQPSIDLMRKMAEVKETGANADLDFEDYKAAGLELSQFCS